LIHVYRNEFGPEIRNLLIAFKIAPWIVGVLVAEFSPQQIIDAFRDGATSDQDLKFFSSLFSLKMEFQMSAELKNYLSRLIAQYPNTTESANVANRLRLSTPATNLDHTLDTLLAQMKAGKQWIPRFERLAASLASNASDSSFATVVQVKLIAGLTSILAERNPQECFQLRIFVCHASQALNGICFASLIEPMLWMLMHDERSVREQSEECYIKLFQDVQCVKVACALLQRQDFEGQQAILTVLLKFLSSTSRDHIVSMVPIVMKSAQRLLQSGVIAIRRLIVLVLVEFKSKAGTEFSPHFRELSAQQQRLIETYVTKRGD
jgi:hypothetical protein